MRKSRVKLLGAIRVSRVIIHHILAQMHCREKAIRSRKAAVSRSDPRWMELEKHCAYVISKHNFKPEDVRDYDEVCQWMGGDPNLGRYNRTIERIGTEARTNGIQAGVGTTAD